MEERHLKPVMGPAGAWALSLGTSVGWGSLVVTCSGYLLQAGPLGSTVGLLIGGIIMLFISRSYAYMINCFPEAGGAYAYSREVFGWDQGFLTAWFLGLTYLAVLWANATSLPLFSRYFLGPVFRVGKLYTLFGYDIYLGEALLSSAAILLTAVLLTRREKDAMRLMILLAVVFSAGIALCFVYAFLNRDRAVSPEFLPDGNAALQIVKIARMSPWAFIGFENISHTVEEFTFRRSRVFRILLLSVISTTLLYIFVTVLSVTAYPPEYASWVEYLKDLGNLEGIKGIPAFYAANYYLGPAGTGILMAALLALILSSLIGNTMALSRLIFALARDRILPASFCALNGSDAPGNATMLVALVSAAVPLIGRTAIGWIVDVTTLGATLTYAVVTASAMKLAGERGDRKERRTAMAGLIVMAGFGLYILLPNLFTVGSMETESYFLFVVWSVLGFLCFRTVLKNDSEKRYGTTIIVWIALLSLILFVSLVWMSRSIMDATNRGMSHIEAFYASQGFAEGAAGIVAAEMSAIRLANARSILVVVALFAMSLGVLLNNYSLMSRRALESEAELGHIRDMANRDPLTGVKSKHAYAEKEAEINGQITEGSAPAFAVAVCDVNGLKLVNDTLGHKAGDEYIRSASRLICEVFQHSPVFRTGGDEFVVVLSGRDYEHRQELIKLLSAKSEENIKTGNVVVAGGLSDYLPGGDAKYHDVFERADALMYREKKRLKGLGAPSRKD